MSLNSGGDTTKRYNIPIEHLDFKYIEKCSDVKELEKIYRVLKSGEEGMFPDLTKFAEERIETLAPKSRVLRKQEPLLRTTDLNRKEMEEFTTDMKKWQNSLKDWRSKDIVTSSTTDPPLRRSRNIVVSETRTESGDANETKSGSKSGTKKSRPMPRSPDEWARLEKQLEKEEEKEEEEKQKKAPPKTPKITEVNEEALPFTSRVPTTLEVESSMPLPERLNIAEAEKAKGNEAFRSGDFQEAAVYYSRSLSVAPQPTVYNNRALAFIKLKKWDEAIRDCGRVIKAEPDNEKALLRRATALTEVHRLVEARRDAERVLQLDPSENRAKKLLTDIEAEEKKREERKEKGSRRLVIEESDSSESSDEEEEEEEEEEKKDAVVDKPEDAVGRKIQIEEVESSEDEDEKPPEEKKEETSHVAETTEESRSLCEEESPALANKEMGTGDIWTMSDVDKENIRPEIVAETKTSPPPPPPPRLTPEQEFLQQKELGNQCVKDKKFAAALEFYDRCVELCPENIIGYNNRAVVNIHLDRPNDAIYDCNMALDIQSTNVKALYRRGLARKMLGDYPESLVDLRAAQVFDPLNKTIKMETEEVQKLLYETGGRRRMVIEEIEDEEEDEEEEEDDSAEPVPVIREEWPDGLPREQAAKKAEDEAIEKEIKAVEAELEAELGPTWRETIEKVDDPDSSKSLLQEAIDQYTSGTFTESFREDGEGEADPVDYDNEEDEGEEEEQGRGMEGQMEMEEEKGREESETNEDEEGKELVEEEVTKDEDKKVETDESGRTTDTMRQSIEGSGNEEEKEEEEEDSWVEVQKGMCESEDETKMYQESRINPVGAEETEELNQIQQRSCFSESMENSAPVTPYVLISTLQTSRADPATTGNLLLRIVPEQLPKYIGCQLDGPSLSSLISALRRHLIPQQKFSLAWRFINSLKDVSRFSIVQMFVGKATKEDLSDIFQTLKQVQEAGDLSGVSAAEISKMQSLYRV